MSKLMKALIAENKVAPLSALATFATYRNIGDAITAITSHAQELDEVTVDVYPSGLDMDCGTPDDNFGGPLTVYSIDSGDLFLGYVIAWRLNDDSVIYTAESSIV